MALVTLSHALSPQSPMFGGTPHLEIDPIKRIAAGQSNNSSIWKFPNHLGTHVDVPWHFDDKGQKLDQFETDFWVSRKIALFECRLEPGELLSGDMITRALRPGIETLLVKTGWEKRRTDDLYWKNNPGVSPEACKVIRNFGGVKFFGFDFISLAAFAHPDRTLGRKAHATLLGPGKAEPVCILEDMKLAALTRAPTRMLVSPLFVTGADGAPCTIWAEAE